MTEAAPRWRMEAAEKRIGELEEEVKRLTSLRDQLIGMSTLAKWGIRTLIVLGGTGGVDLALRFVRWMNQPMPRIH